MQPAHIYIEIGLAEPYNRTDSPEFCPKGWFYLPGGSSRMIPGADVSHIWGFVSGSLIYFTGRFRTESGKQRPFLGSIDKIDAGQQNGGGNNRLHCNYLI